MSQRAFMQAFDATAFASFRAAGLGDEARYQAGNAAAVPCTALIDRDVIMFGDDGGELATRGVRVTLQKSEVGDSQARRGHVLQLIEGGLVVETWKLQDIEQADASSERWWLVSA